MADDYLKLFKKTKDAWSLSYKKAEDDLFFLSDDDYAQWDAQQYNDRVKTGRPVITIDQLGQFVHQVVNDIRQNTPTINVIPSDVKSSDATAKVLKGLIKEIEYYSNADEVYDTASMYSVKCSIGFIRIDHEYEDDGETQRLCLKRVVNPLSIWLDPNSIEADGSDADYVFALEEISIEEFKERFPGKNPVCFEDPETLKEDYITIAEHFYKEDGKVIRKLLSGQDELEETVFPSKYIPIVPVYGEEAWVKGKRQLYSLIRKSKGAQRMYNFWKSLETELLMKSPKAPVMAAVGQIEDFKEDWANPDKAMALRYHFNDAQGNPVGAPQRLEPPTIPTGVVNAARATIEDIKSTMGIYNAALGQVSNETSGIAIQSRQRESDVATYHFADNLTRSITHVGRILIDAIPVVYDTPRILRIIGAEDETQNVGVNGALHIDQLESVDLTEGKYDVRVVTGASFTTRRQEAAQFLANMVNTNPDMLKVVGDLLFKNMDFAGADAMAERIKKVMLPEVLDEAQSPEVLALQQQMQEQGAIIQALQAQLEDKESEQQLKYVQEQNDVQESSAKLALDTRKLEMDYQKSMRELELKEKELALKEQEMLLKQGELQAIAMQQESGINQI